MVSPMDVIFVTLTAESRKLLAKEYDHPEFDFDYNGKKETYLKATTWLIEKSSMRIEHVTLHTHMDDPKTSNIPVNEACALINKLSNTVKKILS